MKNSSGGTMIEDATNRLVATARKEQLFGRMPANLQCTRTFQAASSRETSHSN